jgi:hypothetical protein
MAADPVLAAARNLIADSLEQLRRNVEGLPVAALNWTPTTTESNSIGAIVTHATGSTRNWVYRALGQTPPTRDRASEFLGTVEEPAALLERIASIERECLDLLDASTTFDADATLEGGTGFTVVPPERVTAAWALLHGVDHLREHVGQLFLTRQLWLDQNAR